MQSPSGLKNRLGERLRFSQDYQGSPRTAGVGRDPFVLDAAEPPFASPTIRVLLVSYQPRASRSASSKASRNKRPGGSSSAAHPGRASSTTTENTSNRVIVSLVAHLLGAVDREAAAIARQPRGRSRSPGTLAATARRPQSCPPPGIFTFGVEPVTVSPDVRHRCLSCERFFAVLHALGHFLDRVGALRNLVFQPRCRHRSATSPS